MTHSDMERSLRKRGFELMRVMYQGWLDELSLQERREAAREVVEPGTQVRGWGRNIECDFGRVRLSRLGYKRRDQATVFPLDRELNLPDESYSLEVRQRVAFEAQRGSWDEVVSTVDRDSGAHVPKRQAQQLAQRAASAALTTALPRDSLRILNGFGSLNPNGLGLALGLGDARDTRAAAPG